MVVTAFGVPAFGVPAAAALMTAVERKHLRMCFHLTARSHNARFNHQTLNRPPALT